MIRQLSTVLLVGTCGFVSACGDDGRQRSETDYIEDLEGFGFVHAAIAVSDLCAGTGALSCKLANNPPLGATLVSISQPEPGKLCMKGRIGAGGFAMMVLALTDFDDGKIVPGRALDADSRGISAASFTLDTPPPDGFQVEASVFKPNVDVCQSSGTGHECRNSNFWLSDPQTDQIVRIKGAGKKVVSLDAFVNPDKLAFDTSKLESMYLWLSETTGAIDYCISDFAFLDADGNEVAP